MTSKILKLLFISIFSFGVFSCTSADKTASTAEEAFAIAQEFDKKDRYTVAIQRYNDVKNKFPYSSYATAAELAIADVHFRSEAYPEAQVSYQNFRELHPRHARIDYVIFQIGMSYYQQLPDTFDRDISLANDAIYSFNELIRRFPNSEYFPKAQEHRRKAFTMLNEKELYIADFYFKQEVYSSALLRYESSYRKFPGFGLEPRSLLGAVKSAHKLEDRQKQSQYYGLLTSKFPESDEAKQAQREGLE